MATCRFFALALPLALIATSFAQERTPWRDRWDAAEVMIPMRDGTKLYTVYYVPKTGAGPFPILMERTPYGAGSPAQPPDRTNTKMAEGNYIFAFQDVRGLGNSEGEFVNVRPTLKPGQAGIDESTDTFDTVEYLIKNVPKAAPRVGLWGISYPGFYAGAGAIRNHPALKAISPQAPVNDWFLGDDVHHRGAFFLQETFDFIVSFDVPRGGQQPQINRQNLSAYDFFLQAGAPSGFDAKFLKGKIPYWQELIDNDVYNDYWKDRALWRSFRDVGCAVLTVGGWFDKEDMWGALNLYKAGERQNPGIANYLVMGPWSHGQWAGGPGSSLGTWSFGQPTAAWYRDHVEFPFFERYLRGIETVQSPAEATMFETGVNKWRQLSQWPPKGLRKRSLYLGPESSLTWEKPNQKAAVRYVYDPAKPTPYVADYTTSRRAPGDWLARTQNFLSGRADLAEFSMTALTEDLRVAGPVLADLWITTTGTDADFVVQVLDEYPADTQDTSPDGQSMAGKQVMVRGEVIRAKFRNSWERPEPIIPGRPTRVRLELNDVLHTFRKGHRIRVRVMSSWFPIVDRNPNKFVSRRDARDWHYVPATIDILLGGNQASRLEFGVLPKT